MDIPGISSDKTRPVSFIGLTIAMLGPVLVTLVITPQLEEPLGAEGARWLGLLLIWLCVIGVLVITRRAEQLPLTSLGVHPLSWKDGLLAVGLGIALSVAVPLLTLMFGGLFGLDDADGSITGTAQLSPLLVAFGVLTAGTAEELLFRSYPIERLEGWLGSALPGAILATLMFTLAHIVSWNLAHIVVVVLPYGIILAGLYLWKRNLLFVMIVHLLVDLPLIVIALMG
ncbi:MAG: CPBP family intramembrane metalloprotease [Chloroflexi bacterium]|nr:CPBP family intramembrane metalloprotease [Chloroflexota bacterium]